MINSLAGSRSVATYRLRKQNVCQVKLLIMHDPSSGLPFRPA